jgi:hypothetical protein
LLTSIEEIATPAAEHSAQPNLAKGADGALYLSWIESHGGPSVLKFAMGTTESWSDARTIVESDRILVNWADFPSMFDIGGGALAAHWPSTTAEGGYNVSVALSRDNGATWSPPLTPHRDQTMTEHGFVALAPSANGISVLWLDSRKLEAGSTDVSLMNTNVALDGTLGAESEIDPRVCECCQPSVISVQGGLLAVYRDRTADEIRDIVITRFDGTRWSEPKTVFDDRWRIEACPIQGPAISSAGENVAVVWFTGVDEKYKVQVALSKNGGVTFGAPVQIDEGDPVGRVDVVALEDGGAVATWIEHTTNGGEVRAVQIAANGQKREARTVGKTSVGNASGFPRVERAGDAIVFAWTDTSTNRVRTAVAKP